MASGTHGREDVCMATSDMCDDHCVDLGVDGRVMLKCFLNEETGESGWGLSGSG